MAMEFLCQLSIDLQLIWLNTIKYEYNMCMIWYKYVTIKHMPYMVEYDMITIHYSQKFYLIIIGQPYRWRNVKFTHVPEVCTR